MNKREALEKIEELKKFVQEEENKCVTPPKITYLAELERGDLIEFYDGVIGMVSSDSDVNEESCMGGKCIILIKYTNGNNWGLVADGFLDDFKKGKYKRIIRGATLKVVKTNE